MTDQELDQLREQIKRNNQEIDQKTFLDLREPEQILRNAVGNLCRPFKFDFEILEFDRAVLENDV